MFRSVSLPTGVKGELYLPGCRSFKDAAQKQQAAGQRGIGYQKPFPAQIQAFSRPQRKTVLGQ